MNIFRFRDRAAILDERSQRFLKTVAWLGGYVTPEQARELGIRDSTTRVHVQLKDLESWRFIKPIATYPAVYQVTKSVTRLLGADLAARRQHTLETIRTRLLMVNFYLEAIRWPAEFVFDHQQKVSKLCQLVGEPFLLPHRGGRPYLWQDIVFQRPSGDGRANALGTRRSGGNSVESASGESPIDLAFTTSRDSGRCLLAGRMHGQRHRNAQGLRRKDPSCR